MRGAKKAVVRKPATATKAKADPNVQAKFWRVRVR
jgi:hypothetical protein